MEKHCTAWSSFPKCKLSKRPRGAEGSCKVYCFESRANCPACTEAVTRHVRYAYCEVDLCCNIATLVNSYLVYGVGSMRPLCGDQPETLTKGCYSGHQRCTSSQRVLESTCTVEINANKTDVVVGDAPRDQQWAGGMVYFLLSCPCTCAAVGYRWQPRSGLTLLII